MHVRLIAALAWVVYCGCAYGAPIDWYGDGSTLVWRDQEEFLRSFEAPAETIRFSAGPTRPSVLSGTSSPYFTGVRNTSWPDDYLLVWADAWSDSVEFYSGSPWGSNYVAITGLYAGQIIQVDANGDPGVRPFYTSPPPSLGGVLTAARATREPDQFVLAAITNQGFFGVSTSRTYFTFPVFSLFEFSHGYAVAEIHEPSSIALLALGLICAAPFAVRARRSTSVAIVTRSRPRRVPGGRPAAPLPPA